MAVTLGYSVWTLGTSGTSSTTAAGTTNATGSTFVVGVVLRNATGFPTSVTDSKSNTYTLAQTVNTGGGNGYLAIYSCINGTGGASHTATANWPGSAFSGVAFAEFQNVGAGTFDLAPTGIQNTGGSPSVTPSITTSANNELVVGIFGTFGANAQTITDSGSGFAIACSQPSGTSINGAMSWALPASSGTAAQDSFGFTAFDFTGTLALSIKPAAGGPTNNAVIAWIT